MTKDIETKLSELGINQKILATGYCVTQIDRTKTSTKQKRNRCAVQALIDEFKKMEIK